MSDFRRGPWCETWDGLFWSFIDQHRDYLESNARIGPIVRQLDRMPRERYNQHLSRAASFLQDLERRT